jgi:hypothetical protein
MVLRVHPYHVSVYHLLQKTWAKPHIIPIVLSKTIEVERDRDEVGVNAVSFQRLRKRFPNLLIC